MKSLGTVFVAVFVIGFVAMLVGGLATAEEKKATKEVSPKEEKHEGIVWKMDYFEKTWGIKFKSVKFEMENNVKVAKLLLEFSKDVEDLAEMRKAVGPSEGKGFSSTIYYFFDKDNVVIGKTVCQKLEGELSGKAGDAFRLHFFIHNQGDDIRKIEVRSTAPPRNDSKK